MATAKQILEGIERAVHSARRHCPKNEQQRVDTFVCYLSGALENHGPKSQAVAALVFQLLKNDPTTADGA